MTEPHRCGSRTRSTTGSNIHEPYGQRSGCDWSCDSHSYSMPVQVEVIGECIASRFEEKQAKADAQAWGRYRAWPCKAMAMAPSPRFAGGRHACAFAQPWA